jgi:hypothetical protein
MADVLTVLAADHRQGPRRGERTRRRPIPGGTHAQSTDQRREDLPETPRPGREQGEVRAVANAAAATSRSQVGRKGAKSGSYDDWSKQDLVRRAREIGIKGRSTMSKAQLITALRDH